MGVAAEHRFAVRHAQIFDAEVRRETEREILRREVLEAARDERGPRWVTPIDRRRGRLRVDLVDDSGRLHPAWETDGPDHVRDPLRNGARVLCLGGDTPLEWAGVRRYWRDNPVRRLGWELASGAASRAAGFAPRIFHLRVPGGWLTAGWCAAPAVGGAEGYAAIAHGGAPLALEARFDDPEPLARWLWGWRGLRVQLRAELAREVSDV